MSSCVLANLTQQNHVSRKSARHGSGQEPGQTTGSCESKKQGRFIATDNHDDENEYHEDEYHDDHDIVCRAVLKPIVRVPFISFREEMY